MITVSFVDLFNSNGTSTRPTFDTWESQFGQNPYFYVRIKIKGVKEIFVVVTTLDNQGNCTPQYLRGDFEKTKVIPKTIIEYIKGKKFGKRVTRSYFAQKG